MLEYVAARTLTNAFLGYVPLPARGASEPHVLGIIGNIGSGKTTLGRMLRSCMSGSVHIQANSVRFLLSQGGWKWGENVIQLLARVSKELVNRGYSVILDGATADENTRKLWKIHGKELAVPVRYVRLDVPLEICMERTTRRYEDRNWRSSFEEPRVNKPCMMEVNCRQRHEKVHSVLRDEDIEGLVRTIRNETSLPVLLAQAKGIAAGLP